MNSVHWETSVMNLGKVFAGYVAVNGSGSD